MADLVDGHIPDGYKLMVVAPDDRVVGTLPLDGFEFMHQFSLLGRSLVRHGIEALLRREFYGET